MLARQFRLRQAKDINRVYARGRFGGSEYLQVKALSTRLPGSRVAIVVSKKIAKSSVVRNRIKRRLSTAVADLWQTVLPGYDIVISVRQDISEAPVAALRQQLELALRKSGALTNNTTNGKI